MKLDKLVKKIQILTLCAFVCAMPNRTTGFLPLELIMGLPFLFGVLLNARIYLTRLPTISSLHTSS